MHDGICTSQAHPVDQLSATEGPTSGPAVAQGEADPARQMGPDGLGQESGCKELLAEQMYAFEHFKASTWVIG
ncbi:hypothetical protein ANO14919_076000 [Xylariales sp. No.14919]|nr:hypothetical protein ANO14919_076000 [Xylariales sp. No.14919]